MAPSKVVTTCSKCTYIDTPHDEFPCDICLNSGKLVENMVEPNWAPPGAVKAEKPVVKRCSNCQFEKTDADAYPCFLCMKEDGYEPFWHPKAEKVETSAEPERYHLADVSSWMAISYPPRYGKTKAASAIIRNIGFDTAKAAPKPFWIVCADGGCLEAHVRHDSEKPATDEANRLAIKTGKTFQVFKSVAKVTGKTTASQEKYA